MDGALVDHPAKRDGAARDRGVRERRRSCVEARRRSRRARELVLFSVSRVGNYDYGFEWTFREDGTIAHRVLLTGVMAVKGAAAGHADSLGQVVAPGVDGDPSSAFLQLPPRSRRGRRVAESSRGVGDARVRRGSVNVSGRIRAPSHGRGRQRARGLRHLGASVDRRWVVTNPSRRSTLGQASGYELVPGPNRRLVRARRRARSVVAQGFSMRRFGLRPTRFGAVRRPGATRISPRGGDGLPGGCPPDVATDGDLVLWYTFGVTHIRARKIGR